MNAQFWIFNIQKGMREKTNSRKADRLPAIFIIMFFREGNYYLLILYAALPIAEIFAGLKA